MVHINEGEEGSIVTRRLLLIVLITLIAAPLAPQRPAYGEVESLTLIAAFATLPGETAQVGRFEPDDRIDLLFQFDLDADSSDVARLTWDVYDRYGDVAFSTVREVDCEVGLNELRIVDAIPIDLSPGRQTYHVYASVRVGGHKKDTEFDIQVRSPRAFPGVIIEDVRLIPGEEEDLIPELRGAAIPYILEVDFRVENIISWAYCEIRWLGLTADGFELDRGIGATRVEEGFNSFVADSFLARPPRGATPEADFSLLVNVMGHIGTVAFPIESLPVSLVEIRSRGGVEPGVPDFSVGEAYLATEDGARAGVFHREEPIVARLLTGGVIPENTFLFMALLGREDETAEEFMLRLEPGEESPIVDYALPTGIEREAGFYDFIWTLMIEDAVFAERRAQITLSDLRGVSIPIVIDLPGRAEFTPPLSWQVTQDSDPGRYAMMVTPTGIVCELFGHSLDEPLNAGFLADVFESDATISGLPSDAIPLTEETDEREGEWEYVRRAYLGEDRVLVHSYWLYRLGEGEYQFLIATCTGTEEQVEVAYAAADAIRAGLSL